MKETRILGISILCISLFLSYAHAADNKDISLQQIEKDITYLASDKMEGRGNFSKGIQLAGSYIEQRFKETGLQNAAGYVKGITDFRQTFSLYRIQPKAASVTLNGKIIDDADFAVVSTLESLDWSESSSVEQHILGEKDSVREQLSKFNQQGGFHLVLIDKNHSVNFNRYQAYFKRGLTKISLGPPGAIVMVLTNDKRIKDYKVNANLKIIKQSLTNIVGVIPGQTKPNEIVLFSAHYDHLGMKDSSDISESQDAPSEKVIDRIYNGADDDASGTTAVINLAQYFSSIRKNARTLMFVAFAGEEIGGFGSRFFSNQLDSNDIVAMINIEMIGKHSKFGEGKTWMTGSKRSNLLDLLNKRLESKGTEIYIDPYPKQRLFYRSDNATLARLGVPAHSFSSTQIDKDQFYHQTSDEVITLDIKSMRNVIRTLANASIGLVEGKDTPSRIERLGEKGRGKIF